MCRSNICRERVGSLFSVALLLVLFTCVLWPRAVHAQPVDAGEEPAGGPIVYDLIPTQDAIVAQEELARAGATIETQRDVGVAWAAVFIDGKLRPSALMGPTRYLQSVRDRKSTRLNSSHANISYAVF